MTVVSRVLPWRRGEATDDILAPVLQRYRQRWPRAETTLIRTAFETARDAHAGQRRRSGEDYIHHPVAVAGIVADLGLDDVSIAAALLHDAVEDTGLTLDDIQRSFGDEVARIVDGVTKLDRVRFESRQQQQAATMRKMLVAMADDLRVLLIKLADRLHNMRTIGALRPDKQERIATETLDIYAPLAHRLGMQDLKTQLEELAFAAAHPRRYAEIDHMVATRAPERDRYLANVVGQIELRLGELGIHARVTGRKKHLYSIYEKMVVKGRDFNDIHDLVGVRIVVDSVRDCYAALGSIHSTWRPVQGRFKDYVAMPKFNLYQSLHTTVVGPSGKIVEVQIRTFEMHQRAELGVAAHWQYKTKADRADKTDVPWLNRIVDWEAETSDPDEFMQNLKIDLEHDEVFVFTPKGDVVTLPVGSTPVDFAYSIHTDVGHATIGARLNGRLVPLDRQLVSGDTLEIFTSKVTGAGPSRDWLGTAATPRARNKIRQWFARERREDAIETGKEELLRAFRREQLGAQKLLGSETLARTACELNHADLDSLYAAVGEGHVSARSVAQRLHREQLDAMPTRAEPTTVTSPRPAPRRGTTPSVHVEGLDDVMVRLSRCCTPVPGDEILGFVTRGRGVSVHRADCANAVSLADGQSDRLIDVEWDDVSEGAFVAALEIKALDRAGLLSESSQVFAEHRLNILSCATTTGNDRVSRLRFEFELGDAGHLESLMRALRRIDSVYDVYRLLPGSGPASRTGRPGGPDQPDATEAPGGDDPLAARAVLRPVVGSDPTTAAAVVTDAAATPR